MKLITIDNWREHYKYFHKTNSDNNGSVTTDSYNGWELWLRGNIPGEYMCGNCCLSIYIKQGEELPRVCPYCGAFPMKED